MTEVRFKAAVAEAEKKDQDGYYEVGLADDPKGPQSYVILQKAFSYDAQDRATGMDGPYIEINDQRWSSYKGCTRAILSKASLELHCDPVRMENISKVTIDLSSARIDPNFRNILAEILGDRLEVAAGGE